MEEKDEPIGSLQSQLADIQEQMRVKNHQLEAQALHLQTVLNQKAIEVSGAKTHVAILITSATIILREPIHHLLQIK